MSEAWARGPTFRTTYDAQAFSRSTTSPVSPGPHQVELDIVSVGDEHGLQGRFQQAIGQVLGVALEAQGIKNT
jgi:hypothetical protein